jgi:putative transcriptional regulator
MAKHSNFGKRLIASMSEIADALEGGDRRRLTIREVRMPAEPRLYSAAAVRATRERLNVSQVVFARLMGVSTVLAQSWEQGKRKPSKLARRLLDEINRDLERWREKLRAA